MYKYTLEKSNKFKPANLVIERLTLWVEIYIGKFSYKKVLLTLWMEI